MISCLALLVLVSGCGGAAKPAATTTAPSKPATAPDGRSMSSVITGYAALSADEVSAAQEALRCAEDANCGSTFKATKVKSSGGWAMITVSETDVPLDEAVSFGVYLRQKTPGSWEVVQTGSGLTQEELPDAPAEIIHLRGQT
jgi:hypothetical protein